MLYKLAAKMEKRAFSLNPIGMLEGLGSKVIGLGSKAKGAISPAMDSIGSNENFRKGIQMGRDKLGITSYKRLGAGLGTAGLGTYGTYKVGKAMFGSNNQN